MNAIYRPANPKGRATGRGSTMLKGNIPTISVCMPVFNGREFLPRAFTSLAEQTFKDFEVIVVDDGSTDGSAELAESLMAQHHVSGTVIRSVNRGPEQARDLACRHIRSVVIAQCDCDDRWEPTYLDDMLAVLRRHPEVELVYCDLIERFTDGRAQLKSDVAKWIDLTRAVRDGDVYIFDRGSFFKMLLSGQVLFPPCTMYTKALYERVGPYADKLPALRISLDWFFGLRAARTGVIAFLSRPLLQKYSHDGNVSGNLIRTVSCSVQVLDSLLGDGELGNAERHAARTRGALISSWAAYEAWRTENDRWAAFGWAKKSLRYKWSWRSIRIAAACLIPPSIIDRLRQKRQNLS